MEKLRSKNLCICHYFPSPQNGLALALLARHALLSAPQPAYLRYFLRLLFDLAAFLAGYLCLYPVCYLPFFAFNLSVRQLFSPVFLLGLFNWHKKPVLPLSDKDYPARNNPPAPSKRHLPLYYRQKTTALVYCRSWIKILDQRYR